MPVVVHVDDHTTARVEGEVTVLALDGGLDAQLATAAVARVRELVVDAQALIIDLDQVTLLDEGALRSVVQAITAMAPEVPHCVATTRLSGRMVLERWLSDVDVAIFGSVADARQARAFEGSGYGSGWGPARHGD